jgi:hypothetical protein
MPSGTTEDEESDCNTYQKKVTTIFLSISTTENRLR